MDARRKNDDDVYYINTNNKIKIRIIKRGICVWIHVHMYTCIYISTYVHMCICIYMYM
jgi:hypothetical protein